MQGFSCCSLVRMQHLCLLYCNKKLKIMIVEKYKTRLLEEFINGVHTSSLDIHSNTCLSLIFALIVLLIMCLVLNWLTYIMLLAKKGVQSAPFMLQKYLRCDKPIRH